MHQTLHYRKDGSVATIWLHRPDKKNSLNAQMRTELEELLRDIASQSSIRAVVVTGSPARQDVRSLYVRRIDRPSDGFWYEQVGSRPRIGPR